LELEREEAARQEAERRAMEEERRQQELLRHQQEQQDKLRQGRYLLTTSAVYVMFRFPLIGRVPRTVLGF